MRQRDRNVLLALTCTVVLVPLGIVAFGGGGSGDVSAALTPTSPVIAESACSNGYGSAANRAAIESAMASGTAAQVQSAIASARAARGSNLGCPESVSPRSPASDQRFSRDEVLNNWNSVHAPLVAGYALRCPDLGRNFASAAIGAYAAKRAGGEASDTALTLIARVMEAQRYSTARGGAVPDTVEGVFGGYLAESSSDACRVVGVAGTSSACGARASPRNA